MQRNKQEIVLKGGEKGYQTRRWTESSLRGRHVFDVVYDSRKDLPFYRLPRIDPFFLCVFVVFVVFLNSTPRICVFYFFAGFDQVF